MKSSELLSIRYKSTIVQVALTGYLKGVQNDNSKNDAA